MTAMNRFFVYKKCAKLWIPMVCISIVIIAILELTNLRPFGDSENATGINRLLVTLSYSIIGANLFYCFNDHLPSLSRKYVTKILVKRKIGEIKEQLRLLVEVDLHPFSFEQKSINRETYVADFESTDLSEKAPFNKNESKADLVNKRCDAIINICNELLSSYISAITDVQFIFINAVFCSEFVSIGLRPTIWNENKEPILSYNDNQKKIGLCIYSLYEQSLKLCL